MQPCKQNYTNTSDTCDHACKMHSTDMARKDTKIHNAKKQIHKQYEKLSRLQGNVPFGKITSVVISSFQLFRLQYWYPNPHYYALLVFSLCLHYASKYMFALCFYMSKSSCNNLTTF